MLRSALTRRRSAYRALFAPDARAQIDGEALAHAARVVLEDLWRASHRIKSRRAVTSYRPGDDPNEVFFREGKRAVWLHLQTQLRMTDAQVDALADQEGDAQ